MSNERIAMGINLRKNKNHASSAYGKFYPEVDAQKTLSLRGFAEHMVNHGSIYGRISSRCTAHARYRDHKSFGSDDAHRPYHETCGLCRTGGHDRLSVQSQEQDQKGLPQSGTADPFEAQVR